MCRHALYTPEIESNRELAARANSAPHVVHGRGDAPFSLCFFRRGAHQRLALPRPPLCALPAGPRPRVGGGGARGARGAERERGAGRRERGGAVAAARAARGARGGRRRPRRLLRAARRRRAGGRGAGRPAAAAAVPADQRRGAPAAARLDGRVLHAGAGARRDDAARRRVPRLDRAGRPVRHHQRGAAARGVVHHRAARRLRRPLRPPGRALHGGGALARAGDGDVPRPVRAAAAPGRRRRRRAHAAAPRDAQDFGARNSAARNSSARFCGAIRRRAHISAQFSDVRFWLCRRWSPSPTPTGTTGTSATAPTAAA